MPYSSLIGALPKLQRANADGMSGHSTQQRDDHKNNMNYGREPIAIMGLGCRLPGGIDSPSKLWDTLIQGKSTQSNIPRSRFNMDGFYHPIAERPGSIPTAGGYFLNEDLRAFDNEFFGINNLEATYMDPEQRKLLEVVFECFESAGTSLTAVSGANVGCYVGKFTYDYLTMQNKDPEYLHRYSATGMSTSILANRVSHVFNLQGPSLVVDTACSSALYGLHMACNALYANDCDSAIVAGANLIQSPEQHIATMKAGVLSSTSACHTFDVAADGYGRGESIGAIYIKRLSSALRDGDPIRSVVRGSAVNSNGNSPGITLPVADHQESVIRKAYTQAGLRSEETDYVECHGTGTAVGDPIEVEALSRAFRPRQGRPLLIGSVKPNVGHSEAASAITSIIKVTLALEKGVIPATFGVQELNPKLQLVERHINVLTENCLWPGQGSSTSRRASVNSFGFGGANAHAILEAADEYLPAVDLHTDRALALGRTRFLLPFSAGDGASLEHRLLDLQPLLRQGLNLVDLAYSLALRRSHLSKKGFLLASQQSLANDLKPQNLRTDGELSVPHPQTITYVFTGQGAQWPQMGRDLIQEFQSFRCLIQKLDTALQFLPNPPTWTLHEILQEPKETSLIHEAAYSQPVCTAVQIAMVQLMHGWGLRPEYVVGHSSGEICAAYAAGFVTAEEAIIIAYIRGQMCSKISRKGAMLATGLSHRDAVQVIEELSISKEVRVACINSPENVTISGDADQIAELRDHLQAKGVFARTLRTNGKAYHSHHMATVGQEYSRLVAEAINSCSPSTRLERGAQWISTVTGQLTASEVDHDYWRVNLESPVRFSDAIRNLITRTGTHFVEVGPHAVLDLPIRQSASALKIDTNKIPYSPTLLRGTSGVESLLNLMGNLYLYKHDVDFAAVNHVDVSHSISGKGRSQGRYMTDLPKYKWNHDQILWNESRQSEEFRKRAYPRHDILGSRMHGINAAVAVWRNILRVQDVPWLKDHRIDGQIVFPAAGYLAMAIEAASQQIGTNVMSLPSCYLENVVVAKALVLSDEDSNQGLEVQTSIYPTTSSAGKGSWNRLKFFITSLVGDDTTTHAVGELGFETEPRALRDHGTSAEHELVLDSPRAWYDRLSQAGLNFSGDFRSLTEIRNTRSKDKRVTVATTPLKVGGGIDGQSAYALHPSTIDGILHTALIATAAGVLKDFQLRIPTSIGYMRIDMPALRSSEGPLILCGSAIPIGGDSMKAAVAVRSKGQETLMEVKDCRLAIPFQETQAMIQERHPMLRVMWKPDISTLHRENSDAFESYFDTCAISVAPIDDLNIPRDVFTALDLFVHKDPSLRIVTLQDTARDIAPLAHFLQMSTDFKRCRSLARGSHSDAGMIRTEQITSVSERGLEYGASLPAKEASCDLLLYCRTERRSRSSLDIQMSQRILTQSGAIIGHFDADVVEALENEGLQVTRLRRSQEGDLIVARRNLQLGEAAAGSDYAPGLGIDNKEIVLVERNPRHPLNCLLAKKLTERYGRSFRRLSFNQAGLRTLRSESTVISTIELEDPMLPTITDFDLDLVRLLTNTPSRLLWITGGDLLHGSRPNFALAFGISRSIMLEQPALKFFSIDTDEPAQHSWVTVENLFQVLGQALAGNTPDLEFMQDEKGILRISRFGPEKTLNASFRQKQGLEIVRKPLRETKPCQLLFQKARDPGTAYYSEIEPSHEELELDHVEISTETVHIDQASADVLLGKVEAENSLGILQVLGEVTKVGGDVKAIAQGDKVMALTTSRIASLVRAPEFACVRLRADEVHGLNIPMLAASCTALYGIHRYGDLSKGSKVLVSPGTNHTGMVAIQVAKNHGADVFAVARGPEEEHLLVKKLAIQRDHVLNSSDPSFVSHALAWTDQLGFDFVFNSSKGTPSEAALEHCANFGCVFSGDSATPQALLPGRGISCTKFTIRDFFTSTNDKHKQILESLLKQSMAMFREGQLQLIQPERHFNAGEITNALEYVGAGDRSEKAVLNFQRPDTIVMASPSKYDTTFSAHKSYFLVGCLGGLGRSLTKWMFSRGARNFLFLNRSGLTRSVAEEFVHDLKRQGAEVQVVQGDVSRLSDVENAVSELSSPLGGVIQAAMGLDESLFASISQKQWDTAMAPKVAGTWNVHNAIRGKDSELDFFLMTSSISGSVGVATESNYCASNYFLDVFARYRLSHGLPATSVGLGMISQIGYLHEHQDIQNGLILKGVSPIDADDFLQIIDVALSSSMKNNGETENTMYDTLSRGHILTGLEPLGLNELRKQGFEGIPATFDDPRAVLLNGVLGGGNGGANGTSTSALNSTFPPEVVTACEDGDISSIIKAVLPLITKQFSNFLVTPMEKIDISKPLTGFGMDSLMAAAVRTWFYWKLQVDLPFMTLLSQNVSIRDLAGMVAEQLIMTMIPRKGTK